MNLYQQQLKLKTSFSAILRWYKVMRFPEDPDIFAFVAVNDNKEQFCMDRG